MIRPRNNQNKTKNNERTCKGNSKKSMTITQIQKTG